MFICFFGECNLRQAEAWNLPSAGTIKVNTLAQGAVRQLIVFRSSPNGAAQKETDNTANCYSGLEMVDLMRLANRIWNRLKLNYYNFFKIAL